MTDFDILARLRKLEADMFRLRDRIADLERPRRAPELMAATMPPCPMPPEYDGHMPDPAPIWPVKDEPNA
jgi:hypothetical protein